MSEKFLDSVAFRLVPAASCLLDLESPIVYHTTHTESRIRSPFVSGLYWLFACFLTSLN